LKKSVTVKSLEKTKWRHGEPSALTRAGNSAALHCQPFMRGVRSNKHTNIDYMIAKAKKKTPSWIEVKGKIKGLNKDQLIALLGDLYRLTSENKDFFNTRFSLSDDPIEPYKQIIQDAVHPYLEDNEVLDLERAEDAISRYSKAIDDAKGEAELLIFFVECGNNFTLSYGDIDAEFYDSMLTMYEKAIVAVSELPVKDQNAFKERLREIIDSASGIGWGYYDGLCDLYGKAFPEDY